jgi:hypothetical protein
MKSLLSALLLFAVALPASASTTIHGPETFSVNRNTPYSATISAQAYEALILSFTYDSTLLDKKTIEQDDTFTYGIIADGIETILGEVKGMTSADPAEIASVSTVLPASLNETEFIVFARVVANADSDIVYISNLEVNGEPAWDGVVNTPETVFQKAGGLVTICHFDDATEQFYKETVNIASIIKGKGHGQHGDDIIPLFWYQESRGGDIALHPGNDWNKTNKELYLNECKEGE